MAVQNIISNAENTSPVRRKIKKYGQKLCSEKTLKNRLPITAWLPSYNSTTLIQDIIAGITVGLTAVPQGIAYAIIAGLPPAYGLYSGLFGGFVYVFFGSCKAITIGPTAVMSAMVAKYVISNNADFAVLACFLSGTVVFAMGVLNLGFLVDFISSPVINGFTTAAALQIASGQLKLLFGLKGESGHTFKECLHFVISNVKDIKLWDTVFGFTSITILILLKRLGEGCGRTDPLLKQLKWFFSLGRNAVVIVFGIIVAYIVKITLHCEPMILIGDIEQGLPKLAPPPFSTSVGNETYSFEDILRSFGPKFIVVPLVGILESIAIAKAFAEGVPVNATQEMIALGICNILGSFVRSMPVTGSFARTALNHASGVQTPAGGIFTGMVIVLALTLMTSTFYYIPKTSLASLIIMAMYSMVNYNIFPRLWYNSKREFFVLIITVVVCSLMGLEFGIVVGILIEACILLFITSRPSIDVHKVRGEKVDIIVVPLNDTLSYCAADHVRRSLLKASEQADFDSIIIVNATKLKSMDTTVATNLIAVINDVEKKSRQVKLLNFSPSLKKMWIDINPNLINNFVLAVNVLDVTEIIPKSV